MRQTTLCPHARSRQSARSPVRPSRSTGHRRGGFRGRSASLGAIAVFTVVLIGTLTSVAQASAPRWGVDAYSAANGFIGKAEQAMHHPFSAFSIYSDLDSSTSFSRTASHPINVHALIYLNINSYHSVGGKKTPACWTSVASGARDANLRSWISKLKAVHYSNMIVTFNHEPTVSGNPNQPKCKSDNPTSYKNAFAHVYHMFRNAGLKYRFAFVTTASQFRAGGAYKFMPMGDFQVVGADGYNRFAGKYKTPSYIFSPVHQWAVNHHMPLLVGEIGCISNTRTAGWVRTAASLLRSYGDVIAVNWNGTPKYRLDKRADSWSAFLGASRTYF
jgi:hypothetical protein